MALVLVYDGGCPFCRHFALRSELVGGLPDLQIRDGRADHSLRTQLKARGLDLARGAVLLEGDQAWHGAEAIAELCQRLQAEGINHFHFYTLNRAELTLDTCGRLGLHPDQETTE